jgi:flagellar hook-associated protein 2
VQASIIHDGGSSTPYRLVLTGGDAQTSFSPVLDLTDSGGQPVDLGLVEVRAAQQAIAYVDSIKVISNSNTLTGVISGVTLNLTEVSDTISEGTYEEGVDPADWADPPLYKTNLLTVEADTEALKGKVTNFVDSYNAVMDWISSGYVEFGAPVSKTTEDGEAEDSLALLLRGDATINSVKRSLQNMLSSPVNNSGEFSALSQLGISTRRDGSLDLNTTTLDKRLSENFEDVGKLLAGDEQSGGVMKEFNSALLKMTSGASGMYAEKKERHDAAVKWIDSQILNTEALLQKKEANMRKRFTAMELLVSGMNSQSNFLTQQMDMLSNMMTGKR